MRLSRLLSVLSICALILVAWGCDEDPPGDNNTCEGPLCDVRTLPDNTGGDTSVTTTQDSSTSTHQDTSTTTHQDTSTNTNQDTQQTSDVPEDCGPGDIRGRVCAPSGTEWIGGARVALSGVDCSGNSFTMQVVSDSEGYFNFNDVPAGRHDMSIEKGSFQDDFAIVVRNGVTLDITSGTDKTCFIDDQNVRFAVVEGFFDSIEEIIGRLGVSYDCYSEALTSPECNNGVAETDLLLQPGVLAGYDIVFFNCGLGWEYFYGNKDAIIANLKAFVEGGGSLYVSDWAFNWVEQAWPDAVDFLGDDSQVLVSASCCSDAQHGALGNVSTAILDADLETALGKNVVTIRVPDQGWTVMEGAGAGTDVLVQGSSVDLNNGPDVRNVPMLVRFKPTPTSGTVFFTSFHNEEQLERDIERILHHVIFSL